MAQQYSVLEKMKNLAIKEEDKRNSTRVDDDVAVTDVGPTGADFFHLHDEMAKDIGEFKRQREEQHDKIEFSIKKIVFKVSYF